MAMGTLFPNALVGIGPAELAERLGERLLRAIAA